MHENSLLGVLDIAIGSGTASSLKQFWTYCISKDRLNQDISERVAFETISHESLKQKIYQNTEKESRNIWFCASTSIPPEADNESIDNSATSFLRRISAGLDDIKQGVIQNILVGSFKQVEDGNYELLYLRVGKEDNRDSGFYAELADFSYSEEKPFISNAYDDDNLHEWIVSSDCIQEVEPLLGQVRTNSSLANYCALNIDISDEEIHEWLKSITRATLALHNRTYPIGQKHSQDFTHSRDYVFFDAPSPLICAVNKKPSARTFLLGTSFFSSIRLQASKTSGKPKHFNTGADLFIFSASNEEELVTILSNFDDRIQNQDYETIQASARELNLCTAGAYRAAIVATGKSDLTEKLKKVRRGVSKHKRSSSRIKNGAVWNLSGFVKPKIAGVFPGQGSQHFNMLKALCMRFSSVRDWFDNLDASLVSVNGVLPSLTIFPPSGGLSPDKQKALQENLYSQEGGSAAVVVSSIALYELLQSFGCYTDVLVGHSSGEISAMIVSKVLDFKTKAALFETILSINKKGAAGDIRGEIPKGKFLAVTATEEAVLNAFIEKNKGDVMLAMDNCPQQKVLFFPNNRFDTLHAELLELGVICFLLYFDRAYHTELFEVEMPSIREVYDSFNLYSPRIPIFNCIELADFPKDPEGIKKMACLNWTHCVRFQEACQALSERGMHTFIEIGAGGVLSGFIDNTLHDVPHKALAIDLDGQDSYVQLLNVFANLFVEGVDLNLQQLYDTPEVELVIPNNKMNNLSRQNKQSVYHSTVVHEHLSDTDIAESSEPISGVVRGAVRNSQAASALVQQHFALMNEFLETETRVINAVLSKKTVTRGSTQLSSLNNAQPANRLQADTQLQDKLPMIDSIVSIDEHTCVAKRTISRRSDLFLQHHTFGRFNLKKPKDAAPLPVVPMAMTIEMMAEAASLIVPSKYVVTEISDLKAMRWMTVDNESLNITLHAKLLPQSSNDSYSISVHVYDEGSSDDPYAMSVVTLKRNYPASVPPMTFVAEVPTDPIWDADSFFEQCLFHGEAFSSMDKLLRLGPKEIEVKMTIPEKADLFLEHEVPEFKTPAQLLDSPGHIAAYWKVEMGDKYFGTYPVSIERIQFFSPPAMPGTELTARLTADMSGALIDTELEVYDTTESVFMKISGFRTVYYKLDLSLLRGHYWTGPNTYFCTELLFEEPEVMGFEASTTRGGFHEQSGGVWMLSLVHMYCNAKEKAEWYTLPEKGKRRVEWLLGRIAAKEIVRKWAFHTYCIYIVSPDIEIVCDEDGRPFAICDELEGMGPMPDISITHSHLHAVAVATNPTSKIGVDLETLDGRDENDLKELGKYLEIAFSEEELTDLKKNDEIDLLTLVCAKEAASKAIGTGLLGSMNFWKIKTHTPDTIDTEVLGEIIKVRLKTDERQILTYCTVPCNSAEEIRTKIKSKLK